MYTYIQVYKSNLLRSFTVAHTYIYLCPYLYPPPSISLSMSVSLCVFVRIELTTNQLWASSLEKADSHFPRVPLMWFCWCLFLWDVNIHLAATASSDVMISYFHSVPLVPLRVSPAAVESPSPQSAEDPTAPLSPSSHLHSHSLLSLLHFHGCCPIPRRLIYPCL